MLLYDWRKICKYAGGSSTRVIQILKSMLSTSMPKHRYDPIYKYSKVDFTGLSYLLHPDHLVANRYKWTDKEIADYVGLASFRSLNEYKLNKKLTLDFPHSPLGKEKILKNRLLRIEDNNIHFYYEDYN